MMYRRTKRTRKAPVALSAEEKCATKWCRNKRALQFTYHRNRQGILVKYENFLSHCWKCRARMLKDRHPETYVLNAIRQRAKARGLPFTITLEEFRKFCLETRYLELRGRTADALTIDRIDHDKGYHIWNIQVKTFLENCTNGHVVPGRDCKQNEPKPDIYDYDFEGPEPEYVAPVAENEPF